MAKGDGKVQTGAQGHLPRRIAFPFGGPSSISVRLDRALTGIQQWDASSAGNAENEEPGPYWVEWIRVGNG